jgi:thioredoxin reductase
MQQVAIIGAGPYGMSLAAHLRGAGISFRIFGSPMHNWRFQMPRGMCLKSEGFASNLYDPESIFTLEIYCKREGIPYADTGYPIPLEVFTAYGLEFQKRFLPDLEDKQVVGLERLDSGFRLTLDDGGTCDASRVVVATGISHFASVPDILAGLPEEFVTHSSQHADLSRFKGRDVTVLGAGSSAIDIAALLGKAGASARLLARAPKFKYNGPPLPKPPTWIESLRRPRSGLGPGWKSRLCTDAPLLFRIMPERFRLWIVRRHLGPVAGWFVRKDVDGIVALVPSTHLKAAEIKGNKVVLRVESADGAPREIETDHVIAATGYKPDLRRLSFLDEKTRSAIKAVENSPILSSHFETSVPGLYFAGLASANTFGPMLRFAYGAGFASRRLSRHLRKVCRATVGQTESVLASRAKA